MSRISLFLLALVLAVGFCSAQATSSDEITNVFVVPQSHCDVGWLYTVDEYFDLAVKNILDSVVAALMKDQQRKFIWVETAFFYKWWRQATDTQRQQFRYLLTETKQIEFVIGGWVMNDEALTTYSADIDQMTHGHEFLLREFGEFARPRVGWQIDPFGATATQATMYKLMDFEYTITARIDYQVKNELKKSKGLEFIWEGSPNLKNKSRIFGHVLDDSYCTPWGFDYEGAFPWGYDAKGNPPVTEQNIQNRSEEFVKMLKTKASYYATNNLLFPFGCDFEYREAERNFGNMTLLMNYINARQDTYKLNLKFSLLSEYFDTVVKAKPLNQWPVYKGDFSPYADNEHSYWTGYYTSIPRVKEAARRGERIARTAETLFVTSRIDRNIDRWSSFDNLYELRSANGDCQHHDAITGTERPNVTKMYIDNIDAGSVKADNVSSTALALLMQRGFLPTAPFVNMSRDLTVLQKMQDSDTVAVVVYNSLGWVRQEYVAVPVNRQDLVVSDDQGKPLPSQITGTPGNYQMYFLAMQIPPLGFRTFFVSVNKQQASPSARIEKWNFADDLTLSNEKYDVVICANTGRMCRIRNKQEGIDLSVEHNFFTYESFWNGTAGQTSGAYIFRPLTQMAYPVSSNRPTTTIVRGTEFDEVQQVFSNYATQTIRIYNKDTSFIELEYDIGVLPGNKEFISRFNTNIQNKRQLVHDSNALEMVKRSFNNNTKEPVAANYYPVQYAAYIQDEQAQLLLITDRSHGVASLTDGSIEMMIHRRCMQDDFRGLGENYPLSDTTIVHAKVRLIVDNNKNSAILRHRHGYLNNFPLDVFAVRKPVDWKNFTMSYRTQFTPLSHPVPPNIHLLSLQAYSRDSTLTVLRFINLYETPEVGTVPFYNETVRVNDLFGDYTLYDWIETYLSANRVKSERSTSELQVQLKPIDIRTFLVELGDK